MKKNLVFVEDVDALRSIGRPSSKKLFVVQGSGLIYHYDAAEDGDDNGGDVIKPDVIDEADPGRYKLNDYKVVSAFDGVKSFQPIGADLELAAAAGSAADDNPKFLAAGMGNLLGDGLTKDANYLAGLIGAYSVTGAKATKYPSGGLLGIIMDGVTDVDGGVVAHIDGDSGVTKANAAFKAKMTNSNAGSGFDFGLDLYDPAFGSYIELPMLKADLRLSKEVCVLSNAGVPGAGVGAGVAGPGSLCIDRTNKKAYINGGSKATPDWKLITSA
jgi:hypothetical protein